MLSWDGKVEQVKCRRYMLERIWDEGGGTYTEVQIEGDGKRGTYTETRDIG